MPAPVGHVVEARFQAVVRAQAGGRIARSRMHRRYRIVVVELGNTWTGIVYDPASAIVAQDIDGASAQEVMVKAMKMVDLRLAKA